MTYKSIREKTTGKKGVYCCLNFESIDGMLFEHELNGFSKIIATDKYIRNKSDFIEEIYNYLFLKRKEECFNINMS